MNNQETADAILGCIGVLILIAIFAIPLWMWVSETVYERRLRNRRKVRFSNSGIEAFVVLETTLGVRLELERGVVWPDYMKDHCTQLNDSKAYLHECFFEWDALVNVGIEEPYRSYASAKGDIANL